MYKQDLLSKQIGLSKSHSKPGPYCKRIRGDTSHRYLDLTRKREKKKREEGSTDVEYCDISFGISFVGRDILKDSFSASVTRYKVNITAMIEKQSQSHLLPFIKK